MGLTNFVYCAQTRMDLTPQQLQTAVDLTQAEERALNVLSSADQNKKKWSEDQRHVVQGRQQQILTPLSKSERTLTATSVSSG